MPPKGNRKNIESQTAVAMADCVLPLDMMLCILTRLPVKSIHRFKSVCKQLREVFSSPEFAKMHRAQFPQNPENQSVLVYGYTANFTHAISLLKIESDEKKKKPTKPHIPLPRVPWGGVFVGCCNGLLCMSFLPHRLVVLWNPALNNMFKCLLLLEFEYYEIVSVGFGYNEEADDFKVIIIADLERNEKMSVEVYSANSDSWSTIDVGFPVLVFRSMNDAIVNGSPYWVAMVDEKAVLVCLDVGKMVFKIVPLPEFIYKIDGDLSLVDCKGDLGALVCNKENGERVLSIDVWVFDDVGKSGWTKNHSFGPIELKVHRFLQCFKNGKILVGEYLEDEKLFVFDTENNCVKETLIDEGQEGPFQVYGYTENLACVKGMETSMNAESLAYINELETSMDMEKDMETSVKRTCCEFLVSLKRCFKFSNCLGSRRL